MDDQIAVIIIAPCIDIDTRRIRENQVFKSKTSLLICIHVFAQGSRRNREEQSTIRHRSSSIQEQCSRQGNALFGKEVNLWQFLRNQLFVIETSETLGHHQGIQSFHPIAYFRVKIVGGFFDKTFQVGGKQQTANDRVFLMTIVRHLLLINNRDRQITH